MPAYPTTRSRSPETSPEVAYLTSSVPDAPSRRRAVSMATAGPNPHMLMSSFITTSIQTARVHDQDSFDGFLIFDPRNGVVLVMVHVAGGDQQHRFARACTASAITMPRAWSTS